MSQLVEDSIKKLREHNVRITPQRYAILEFLVENDNHPTADDIYQALVDEFPSMSVATVYNNLRLFTSQGLVNEMMYGDTSSRFDFASSKHYHAICSNCGKIKDIYYPGLDDIELVAERLTGYEVENHRMEVYGLCPACQEEQKHEEDK